MRLGTGRVRRKKKTWMNGLRWWRRCYLCLSSPPKEASSLLFPFAPLSLKDKRKGHKVGSSSTWEGVEWGGCYLRGRSHTSESMQVFLTLLLNKSFIWDRLAVVRDWSIEPELSTKQFWAVPQGWSDVEIASFGAPWSCGLMQVLRNKARRPERLECVACPRNILSLLQT